MVDVESGLGHLGRPGCFHIIVFICLGLNNVIVVLNHLAMVVFAPKMSFECHVPDELYNETVSNMTVTPGECSLQVNSSVNGTWVDETRKCPGSWDYRVPDQEYSLIMQFDLVCEKRYMIHLSTTIYFCGVMIGGLIFGTLSDLFGRKPFLLLTQFTQIGIGVWIAFASNFVLFILLRFIHGILMQGLQTTSIVMIMELFPRRYSAIVGSGFEIFWAVGVMWLALLGYAIQNWKYIQLAIAIPSVITVFYIWLIPESVRWLVVHKKSTKAEDILKKAAKFNKVTLPSDPLKLKTTVTPESVLQEEEVKSSEAENGTLLMEENQVKVCQNEATPGVRYSLLDVFRTPEIRKRSFIQFYIWFVATCTYYGISLRLSSFAGNKYLNLFYGGLCELPVYCAACFILARFGRRRPLFLYLIMGGCSGVAAGVTSKIFGGSVSLAHLSWIPVFLAVISRVSMAGCFSLLWLYSSELYPTVIRNVSLGACTFCMRIGAMVAPQILLLGDLTYPYLPIIIFGSLCLVGGLISLFLPETKDVKLPETIDDIENSSEKCYSVRHPGSGDNVELKRNLTMTNGDIKTDMDTETPDSHLKQTAEEA